MFAGFGTRVRTFWQDQRAAFARLVARDPISPRVEAHYAAVFRRERDEALAELNRLRDSDRQAAAWLQNAQQRVDTALVNIRPTPQEIRWAFDNDLEAGAMFDWNVGRARPFRTRPTTYRDTEQEDL